MSKAKSTGKSKAEAGLLQAVRDMKAGRAARVFVPDGKGGMVRSEVARARLASGLTQQKFASLLGVSLRTLQEWEQGRKNPSGAARTLLKIAGTTPKAYLRWRMISVVGWRNSGNGDARKALVDKGFDVSMT